MVGGLVYLDCHHPRKRLKHHQTNPPLEIEFAMIDATKQCLKCIEEGPMLVQTHPCTFSPFWQVAVTLARIIEWPTQFNKYLEVMKSIVKISPAFIVLECSLLEVPGIPKSVQGTLIEISVPALIWLASVPIWIVIWLVQWRRARGRHPKLSRYAED